VKGSLDKGLIFDISEPAIGYIDSEYASDLDRRHSIFGYIFTLCVGAISWKESLQSIAILSTSEVEYVAATEGIKEATWLRGLIIELAIAQDTTIGIFYS